ncbi:MAG: 50S ribosomal protein L4 [Verrucomicrobia bacterium]|nr:MAG: 50S ribosomal protein L4 [Verrucomicrobiota bacterium]TAE87997.1 MAG: 50S ribosomal protein L4 [Verrucomicrobiota bacterium]TAF26221.1 MAG: 50S ribosomal protein L4 [Verrucomicrobiota bacterium]TAF41776.1 MAG: 50S ribosomal protein L4 [Verrucomicrobiota bacterium]
MPAKTFTADDAQGANIVLGEPDKGAQAVHDLVTAYRANRRTGSANTKTRGEVRGNNKKIYKQKGTGNARHGDKRAPIFVGGGVVFGPRPRDYSKHVPKNVRKLALRRVLGDLVREGLIKTVSSFSIADGKTKSFIAAITADFAPKKVLVVAKSFDETTYLAARNVGWAQLVTAESLNVEELLHADSILMVEDAFETLAQRTA